MAETVAIEADLEGELSPPRDNGDLVFAAPWERRAFGVALALCRSGACDWERFRERLIVQIAQDEHRPYWESWSAALEDVLADSGAVTSRELDARETALRARPHGHDHPD